MSFKNLELDENNRIVANDREISSDINFYYENGDLSISSENWYLVNSVIGTIVHVSGDADAYGDGSYYVSIHKYDDVYLVEYHFNLTLNRDTDIFLDVDGWGIIFRVGFSDSQIKDFINSKFLKNYQYVDDVKFVTGNLINSFSNQKFVDLVNHDTVDQFVLGIGFLNDARYIQEFFVLENVDFDDKYKYKFNLTFLVKCS